MAMSLDSAFLLNSAKEAESNTGGSLVVKFYFGTLDGASPSVLAITTDFSYILAAIPWHQGNGAIGNAETIDATFSSVNGASVVTLKCTNGSTKTVGCMVIGYASAQQ